MIDILEECEYCEKKVPSNELGYPTKGSQYKACTHCREKLERQADKEQNMNKGECLIEEIID